ncbi:2-phospho-L-lactate guanylyltransferase [Cellulomonas fimi]|uniref:Phosphoenolpyruvate guanylyltransferase n=1 Tax=Cellulomonas fimi (strain ATCC 484 / DSM 20113 / JCM 1341 / CCUG 24087 / LMG 16345 / NBRC 15513 / NCIMB 8980 / NCTC 7547 / NRS-133) TaxID=590998 RepID=F4H6F1_CELFA|nr:2-phospho-L-lactate guanylyltransferase [Cellulomonas fimi]AEE45584.1 2-phospho-L-lactate guanylyltransferase CofC [Cellulomonas fimi ATCC 484]NNH05906.1 2-phospho-L-lactate guanylyltransferase [Cellulomonas fimi]VEH29954.1 2-phospho-L-lactate guanylyltransferase [Cellulomonas fimi]
MTAWTVVVPVKDARRGKSRLAPVLPDDERARFVRSMALDTLAAASAADDVERVVLVTPDPLLGSWAQRGGAVVVDEPPGGGLDAAVLAGVTHARRLDPSAAVAVLLGDLPGLRPDDLDAALRLASAHPRAHVPDAQGTGTTLLTAAARVDPRPAFGAGSSARHAAAGHVRLDVPSTSSLRHDVDDPADLDTLVDVAAAHRAGPRSRMGA